MLKVLPLRDGRMVRCFVFIWDGVPWAVPVWWDLTKADFSEVRYDHNGMALDPGTGVGG